MSAEVPMLNPKGLSSTGLIGDVGCLKPTPHPSGWPLPFLIDWSELCKAHPQMSGGHLCPGHYSHSSGKGHNPSSNGGNSGQSRNLRRRQGEREKQMRQMCGPSRDSVA